MFFYNWHIYFNRKFTSDCPVWHLWNYPEENYQSFQIIRLSIPITSNIKFADILNVTFILKTESYQPVRAPNSKPTWIDIDLKDPPKILKQNPKSTGKQLSKNVSTKKIYLIMTNL